jgi:putative glutamine amidotransferase
MPKSKKQILISSQYSETAKGVTLFSSYSDLSFFLYQQGYQPIINFLHPTINKQDCKEISEDYLESVSGLILLGGADIDPELYGEANYSCHSVLPFRDQMEMSLIQTAIAKNIPILGVCRGFQMLNVFFGGSLHQQLGTKFQKHDFDHGGDNRIAPSFVKKTLHHKILLEPDGLLFDWFRQDSQMVNSFHHQGVKNLGKNLKVEATSSDGLVEAFSHKTHQILAVQWHPELNLEIPHFSTLFTHWLQAL